MRIEKITQYSYNNENSLKTCDRQGYAGVEFPKTQTKTPSFCGFWELFDIAADNVKRAADNIGRFLDDFFDTDDRSTQRKSRYSPEYYRHLRAKEQERPIRKSPHPTKDTVTEKPVKPQTEITPRTAEPVPVVPERYTLVDEYDKRMKARAEFRNKTRGRALTPEEKAESDRLRLEWKEISDRIIPEHQSIVKTKTAADFANDVEKKKYIMNYVLPRMYKSEESALDALDMFEQFGFRADYPTDDGVTLVTTLTNLSNSIYSMPKECRSDKLLKRFIEVYGKYADNIPREFPDDDGLYCPLIRYGENGIDIQEDTILKGLELMKKIACQKAMYEGLDTALVSGYNAKFKNSEPVKKALEELKDVVKDMKYRLEVDDFC